MSQHKSPGTKAQGRDAARIPDKPRDCGPNVDTWPILDEPPAETKKAGKQTGENPKPHH